jgi:hypothetical protein
MNMKRLFQWPYIIPTVVVLAPLGIALFVAITGGIVMLLWNWLLPTLFGWPEITLLQGFGLLALGRILFGGFGGGGGGGQPKHMTPEERERVRQRMCAAPRESTDTLTSAEPSSPPRAE